MPKSASSCFVWRQKGQYVFEKTTTPFSQSATKDDSFSRTSMSQKFRCEGDPSSHRNCLRNHLARGAGVPSRDYRGCDLAEPSRLARANTIHTTSQSNHEAHKARSIKGHKESAEPGRRRCRPSRRFSKSLSP